VNFPAQDQFGVKNNSLQNTTKSRPMQQGLEKDGKSHVRIAIGGYMDSPKTIIEGARKVEGSIFMHIPQK
jgi:hypothetical protein